MTSSEKNRLNKRRYATPNEKWQVQKRIVSTLEDMQVPNATGSGFWKSKRPLLTSHTRCKCSVEISMNLVIRSESVMRSSSVTRPRFSKMSYQCWVSMYRVISHNFQECHVTFWEGYFIMFNEIPISTTEFSEILAVTYFCLRSWFVCLRICMTANKPTYHVMIMIILRNYHFWYANCKCHKENKELS